MAVGIWQVAVFIDGNTLFHAARFPTSTLTTTITRDSWEMAAC